jgi:hypothetical protein
VNWLKKGPDLKLPSFSSLRRSKDGGEGGGSSLQAPGFLSDLYYDLRERRLLPLILLVLVAIVAVPFLLGNSEEVTVPETASTAGASDANGKTLAVVAANPGLRDPKKRLKGETATDPFKQKFTGAAASSEPEEEGSEGSSGETSSFSSTSGEESEPVRVEVEKENGETVTVEREGGNGAPGSTGPVSPNDPRLRFYGFRPNVRFGKAGSEGLKDYPELEVGTRLPEKKPVAVFLGVSDDGKRATFALTPEVILVQGEGQCIGGAQSCTLLTLKAGDAVSLVTGSPDRTFRLNVTSIQWVEVDPPKPQKASSSSRKPYLNFAQSFSK